MPAKQTWGIKKTAAQTKQNKTTQNKIEPVLDSEDML